MQEQFWNERTLGLQPYIPGEQPQERTYIKLNTNENPYAPSPLVLEAIKSAANERLRLYPDPECRELRATIAERYEVQPEQVFVGNGSDEVLAFAFGAFFSGKILFPDISYSFYPVYANLWGLDFECPPLDEHFVLHPSAYYRDCGGIVFPNPNAPTGRSLSAEEVLSIVQAVPQCVVIVDEAYGAFGAESVVPYLSAHPNLLTVHTLSKSASLAGLRVGFAIGGAHLIEGLCRVRDSFNSYTVDRLAQAGAAAALRDRFYYEELTCRIVGTRERTAASLCELGYEVIPSKANFLFVRSPVLSGADFFQRLRARGVLVRHFAKARIADFLRVTIGTDPEMDIFLQELH